MNEAPVPGIIGNGASLSNKHNSVEGLFKEAIALEIIGDIGIYYAKKEATNLIGAGVQFPKRLQEMMTSNPYYTPL